MTSAPTDIATPGTTRSAWHRLRRPQVRLLLAFLVLVAVFGIANPSAFLNTANWSNILLDVSALSIIAIGATLVLAMGEFDLSISAVVVLSGVCAAMTMNAVEPTAPSILLGLLVALGVGLFVGAISGVIVSVLRIPSIIATLGVLGVAQGAALLLTDGVDVRSVPRWLVLHVGNGKIGGIVPWLAVIAAVVAVIAGLMLTFTRFGRSILAVGSNEEAARRVGVDTRRVKITVFALAGSLYGLGGYLSLARFSTTTIAGHGSDMLDAYTAAILGGNSPFGGIGSIFGTVIGVFIPVVLRNGFVIVDVQPFWQQVAVGVILVVAVYLQRNRRQS